MFSGSLELPVLLTQRLAGKHLLPRTDSHPNAAAVVEDPGVDGAAAPQSYRPIGPLNWQAAGRHRHPSPGSGAGTLRYGSYASRDWHGPWAYARRRGDHRVAW